jgi:CubicO group peptidase (beta-lactamase class C family)
VGYERNLIGQKRNFPETPLAHAAGDFGSYWKRSMASSADIDRLLRHATAAGEIPGVVAVAGTSREVIYQGAFGRRDVSKPQPMTLDSVFWLTSLTKAVTSVAAMQLVEQGRLSLDGPIARGLPDLAEPRVLEGFEADGSPKLRRAKGAITLRQLLTHTAGFCYDVFNGDMATYLERTGTPPVATCTNAALRVPIMSDPGTRFQYGISTDWVGKAIEAVSGQRLDVYFRDNIFTPLGINDTAFRISDTMRSRLVGIHSRGPDGSLMPIPYELAQEPEVHLGGSGLYGTARDYLAFTRMILNKGRGNGLQVLKPETVDLMGRNHIGDLLVTRFTSAIPAFVNDLDLYPDIPKKWGLGWMINEAKTPEGRSAGSLAWVGTANTYYWIDPARDVAGVILMQLLPFADPECLDVFAAFERSIYATLDARSHAARAGQDRQPAAFGRDNFVGASGRER